MQWFRMYAEFATDPVVQSLSFDDQRHFVIVLCLKCSGVLDREFGNPQARATMLRRALGLEGVAFDEAKTRLCVSGLITAEWQPKNWDKRQFLSDHSAAERMRKYRERNSYVTVTSRVTKSDVLDTESETESETEGKGDKKRVKRAPTASRLPIGWELTEGRKKTAEGEGVDPTREHSKFCDYWLAASGANARKHDWDAAWRNWCRKARDMVPRGTERPRSTWRPDPNNPEDVGPC